VLVGRGRRGLGGREKEKQKKKEEDKWGKREKEGK
jgi:hypothetical protein